jgi:hypothetical protein
MHFNFIFVLFRSLVFHLFKVPKENSQTCSWALPLASVAVETLARGTY